MLILFINNSSFAQRKSKKANFENDKLTTNIPEEFNNFPAVIIYKKRHVIVSSKSTGDVTRFRCKILNKNGLDLFSEVQIIKTKEQKLVKVYARTLKQNGIINNLDVKDIKYTDIEINQGEKPNLEILKFIVPNVEVGDEIEYVVELNTPKVIPGLDYYFHSFVPTLYSSFKFEQRGGIHANYLLKNEMGNPQTTYDSGDKTFEWNFINLEALRLDEDYSTILNSIPSVSIAVRWGINTQEIENINPGTWQDIYTQINKDYSNSNFNKSYQNENIDSWLDDWISKQKNKNKTEIIKDLVHFFYDSLEVVMSNDKIKLQPGYQFIYEKKIDENNYYNIINLLFKKLDVNFYLGCAVNKYSGFISENFPTIHNITNKFILFESEDNQLHYIHLPLYQFSYRFDELPYTILGTRSMIIKEIEKDKKYQVVKFNIPQSTYTENTRNTNIVVNHSLKNQKSSVTVAENLYADFNTLYNLALKEVVNKEKSKKDFIQLWNLKTDDIDTVKYETIDKYYPFNSKLSYSYTSNSYVNSIGDDTYSISIDDLIQHFIILSSSYERYSSFSLPFPFKDKCTVEFIFDKNINLETKINSIGSNFNLADYDISIEQKGTNSILITSTYAIENANLTASSSPQLHLMNSELMGAKNRKIIFSVNSAPKPATTKKKVVKK